MTITLTTFIPGTKAKADEVNANFSVLKTAIETKADSGGDGAQTFSVAPATQEEHAVNKSQLDDVSSNLTAEIKKTGLKFCAKAGNKTNGIGDLFSYNVLTITPRIGGTFDNLIIADYKGLETTISTTPENLVLTGSSDGNYNIFITPQGTLYALKNTIYRQKNRPSMIVNDIWLDTSEESFNCIKYNGTNDSEFLDVPLGKVTIENSNITNLETFSFTQNGYNVNIETQGYRFPDYSKEIAKTWETIHTAETDGWIYAYSANFSATLIINNIVFNLASASSASNSGGIFMPIPKGTTYKGSGGSITILKFFPAI